MPSLADVGLSAALWLLSGTVNQYGRTAARDLLMPYGDLAMVLSMILRIRRTLDGAEIDKIIVDVLARKALAVEHRRRADWHKAELGASRFRSECHADAAGLPRSAPDRVR